MEYRTSIGDEKMIDVRRIILFNILVIAVIFGVAATYDPSENYQFYGVYDVSNNLEYSMSAAPNAAKSDASWQIKKLSYDGSGNLTDVQYAQNSDGNASAAFVFVANNYASYTYGP